MVIERFAKGTAATAGAGAGGFAGGFFSSPTFIILGALIVGLVFFAGDIRKALGSFGENFGKVELPDITLPEINFPKIEFPEFEFPEITFPDITFPDFSFLGGLFGGDTPPFSEEPTEEEVELPSEGLGPVTFPEGCFVNELGQLDCPSPPTFNVCAENPELCEEEAPDQIIPTPEQVEQEDFEKIFTPPLDLPVGFIGSGPSFEGGAIFETPTQFLTLSQIIEKFNVSASQAADILAQAKDDFGEFDFGTSTGSGIFGPPTGEESIVTGGATLESEAQKAACVSCELFGLNCPLCSGTI